MKKINYLISVLTLCVALESCHKNNDTVTPPAPVTTGLYVLNQGNFNANNSSMSFYSYTTKQVTADQFSAANARGLGDTGNDIEIYGSKTYIVVNVSSTVEVINTKTSKSLGQIKFFNGTVARQPRSIAFYRNNAFVTAYDGTVAVIDTATLSITKSITVGSSPEQLAVANGKLYVANSGGLNYPNFGTTVSVIDLSTLAVTKTITVVANPQNVAADSYGNVYVLSQGDYGSIGPSLAIIDNNTDVLKSQTSFNGSNMTIQGDNLYFTSSKNVIVYNVKSQTLTNSAFITDGTVITTPYSLAVDGSTGEVFVGDARNYVVNGTVSAFSSTGKLEYSFTAGINPGKIALIKQ